MGALNQWCHQPPGTTLTSNTLTYFNRNTAPTEDYRSCPIATSTNDRARKEESNPIEKKENNEQGLEDFLDDYLRNELMKHFKDIFFFANFDTHNKPTNSKGTTPPSEDTQGYPIPTSTNDRARQEGSNLIKKKENNEKVLDDFLDDYLRKELMKHFKDIFYFASFQTHNQPTNSKCMMPPSEDTQGYPIPTSANDRARHEGSNPIKKKENNEKVLDDFLDDYLRKELMKHFKDIFYFASFHAHNKPTNSKGTTPPSEDTQGYPIPTSTNDRARQEGSNPIKKKENNEKVLNDFLDDYLLNKLLKRLKDIFYYASFDTRNILTHSKRMMPPAEDDQGYSVPTSDGIEVNNIKKGSNQIQRKVIDKQASNDCHDDFLYTQLLKHSKDIFYFANFETRTADDDCNKNATSAKKPRHFDRPFQKSKFTIDTLRNIHNSSVENGMFNFPHIYTNTSLSSSTNRTKVNVNIESLNIKMSNLKCTDAQVNYPIEGVKNVEKPSIGTIFEPNNTVPKIETGTGTHRDPKESSVLNDLKLTRVARKRQTHLPESKSMKSQHKIKGYINEFKREVQENFESCNCSISESVIMDPQKTNITGDTANDINSLVNFSRDVPTFSNEFLFSKKTEKPRDEKEGFEAITTEKKKYTKSPQVKTPPATESINQNKSLTYEETISPLDACKEAKVRATQLLKEFESSIKETFERYLKYLKNIPVTADAYRLEDSSLSPKKKNILPLVGSIEEKDKTSIHESEIYTFRDKSQNNINELTMQIDHTGVIDATIKDKAQITTEGPSDFPEDLVSFNNEQLAVEVLEDIEDKNQKASISLAKSNYFELSSDLILTIPEEVSTLEDKTTKLGQTSSERELFSGLSIEISPNTMEHDSFDRNIQANNQDQITTEGYLEIAADLPSSNNDQLAVDAADDNESQDTSMSITDSNDFKSSSDLILPIATLEDVTANLEHTSLESGLYSNSNNEVSLIKIKYDSFDGSLQSSKDQITTGQPDLQSSNNDRPSCLESSSGIKVPIAEQFLTLEEKETQHQNTSPRSELCSSSNEISPTRDASYHLQNCMVQLDNLERLFRKF